MAKKPVKKAKKPSKKPLGKLKKTDRTKSMRSIIEGNIKSDRAQKTKRETENGSQRQVGGADSQSTGQIPTEREELRVSERTQEESVRQQKPDTDSGKVVRPSEPIRGLAAKLQSRQEAQPDHIVVQAYAGTGKTFTQIVGVARAFGSQLLWQKLCEHLGFEPVPSDEQAVVWGEMRKSRGQVRTITYCAFNKSIVTEFGEKWGWLVQLLQAEGITLKFATVNALGNSAVYKAWGRMNITDDHVGNLLADVMNVDIRDLRYKDSFLLKGVSTLVGLCKLTMVGWTEENGFDPYSITQEALDEVVSHYDLELNGSGEKVYFYTPEVLKRCMDISNKEIDFNDQNWLPIIHKLPVFKSDLLLVDEGQDLPRCKQEFAQMAGKRILLVGDMNQAIYGFAGADTDSIPRMQRLLGGPAGEIVPLRLTETRRCSQAVVREAQKIVPDFKAHENNPEGIVRHTTMDKYAVDVDDKDMVLCRVNAPLVSQALKFIKDGRKAVIRGREFGKTLVNFVKKLNAADVPDLIAKANDWLASETKKENAKRNPSESKLMALQDRFDCVLAFTQDATGVGEVVQKMELVFSGKMCPQCKKHFDDEKTECWTCRVPLVKPEGVLFSSIHRAKGLEANRVFFLEPKGATCPHPMARSEWQKQQEWNCRYIGITRAINELVFVSDKKTQENIR